MGLSKTDKFTAEQNQLASLAKAMAHPARIAILNYLAKTPTCVCGDIVNELPLSQSTVSQHLKELKSAGLIKGTIEGPSVCYCIDMGKWHLAKEEFKRLFDSVNKMNTCC